MDPRNTQRGGARAQGVGSFPLDFANWVEHFLGSRGELRGTDAYTKTTDGYESPRGRQDVAIVSGCEGESEPVITTWDEHRCCFGLSCRMINEQDPTPSVGGLR
jgi:hypothetical protein